MKTRSIRFRFFMWLAVHTVIVFAAIAFSLVAYDFSEYLEDPTKFWSEVEEASIVVGAMLVLFPVSLFGAWLISRRLLRPWRSLVEQAEGISSGRLEERIQAENPDDEIGRLSATLNQAFDRYELLLDRMHRFGYDVSHQLRNPLAAIRMTGEVCLKNSRTGEEYRAAIGEMLESVGRLARTVEQLLMLARAVGGALEEFRAEISLEEIAGEVVQEARVIGELRDLAVHLESSNDPLRGRGVPELLREALSNLLDNALKYSPDGGEIRVCLERVSPSLARITVCDSGPGLDALQKSVVFRPFKQGSAKGKESVGLGLAIVADICRAHEGRFGVDDNPGGGCRFWIELPISRLGMD